MPGAPGGNCCSGIALSGLHPREQRQHSLEPAPVLKSAPHSPENDPERAAGWRSSCAFSARFARRLAGPALEGMRKGADVSIAKQPCNLGNGQVPVGQMAICEVGSKTVQEFGECEPFLRQPPGKRSLTHPELAGNFAGCALPCGSSVTMASRRSIGMNREFLVDEKSLPRNRKS